MLAWLIAQKPWVVPIPGTTQIAHMLDNSGAGAVRFTPVDIAELDGAVRAIWARGSRLPDAVPDAVLAFRASRHPQGIEASSIMENELMTTTGDGDEGRGSAGRAVAAIALAMASPVEAQERPSVAPKNMQAIAPALAGYTDDVLFGDVWVRPGLSPRDRSMVTLSVLIATGRTAQLPGHLNRGLANGLRPTEIAGMATHLAFYTGWPNAVSALNEIEKVFGERNIDPAPLRQVPRIGELLAADDATRAAGVRRDVAPTAPKFAELTNDVVFGDLWRRSDLKPRDRSLVTIAALAANGDTDQLAFHIPRGVENGLTRAEIAEAFTHLAFYAGWPKASAAIAALSKVSAEAASTGSPTGVQVVAPGQTPTAGPASNFTGSVVVTSPFKGTGDARLGGATVTFEPGARTNWHSHPLGQLLVVTAGEGRVQAEGEAVRVIRAGDTVWTGPGVRHWHGAAPGQAMTHVAVSEALDGASVTWLGPVDDRTYRRAPAATAGAEANRRP